MYAAGNSQDDKFLQELQDIVLENLQNEQFSVELLARLKGVSRSQLHRRLKLLKGQSVSQFVREVKLNEAMKLLQQEVGNVSEIAYRVGFSSTSYFNTCFHEHYGYPPGEVKKRNQIPHAEPDEKARIIEKRVGVRPRHSTESSDLKQPASGSPKRSKAILIAFLAVVALAAVFLVMTKNSKGEIPDNPSVAILPLEHLSDRPDQEYLTAGFHDALIGELGTIEGLRVISRTSTLRYPKSDLLMQDIARELGVDVIVEGSVFITGDSMRLQLQLIKPFPEESHIWAQEYYREINDILSLESSVIQDIAQSIEVRLSAEDKKRLDTKKQVDPEAYKAYLRGIYFLNKSTPADFQKGLDFLHQAIENDPANAYSYAGLAEGYIALLHGPNPSITYWQRAKAAAARAIELDSTLAKAHAVLAMIKLYHENDWEGAEQAFIKASNLNPDLAINHFHYAWYKIIFGQREEALKEQKLAKELDPLTPIYTADLGSMYYWLGQYDEAKFALDEALELDSAFGHSWWMMGNVLAQQGKFDQ
ncbi:MAG: helix-turn-helix domain-containing protein, partial [Cyclobacteriaceae bacterium]|nr:helix-turn-helix domain-containing protein [Cyclobacteriaceae bacterium]